MGKRIEIRCYAAGEHVTRHLAKVAGSTKQKTIQRAARRSPFAAKHVAIKFGRRWEVYTTKLYEQRIVGFSTTAMVPIEPQLVATIIGEAAVEMWLMHRSVT